MEFRSLLLAEMLHYLLCLSTVPVEKRQLAILVPKNHNLLRIMTSYPICVPSFHQQQVGGCLIVFLTLQSLLIIIMVDDAGG